MNSVVKLNIETLRSRGGRGIAGVLWFVVDGRPFPSVGWDDFVDVVLTAFATGCGQLLRRESDVAIVHLMEGPYAIELAGTSCGRIRLSAVERGVTRRVAAVGEVDAAALAEEVLAACAQALERCQAQVWCGADVGALELSAKKLAAALASAAAEPSP